MKIQVYHKIGCGWGFLIKGTNGKTLAKSAFHKKKYNCYRLVNVIAKTIVWKVQEV